jgi:hypothetical protein
MKGGAPTRVQLGMRARLRFWLLCLWRMRIEMPLDLKTQENCNWIRRERTPGCGCSPRPRHRHGTSRLAACRGKVLLTLPAHAPVCSPPVVAVPPVPLNGRARLATAMNEHVTNKDICRDKKDLDASRYTPGQTAYHRQGDTFSLDSICLKLRHHTVILWLHMTTSRASSKYKQLIKSCDPRRHHSCVLCGAHA